MQNIAILATKEDRAHEKSQWLKDRPIKLNWLSNDTNRALVLTQVDAEELFLSLAEALGIEIDVERDGETLPDVEAAQ